MLSLSTRSVDLTFTTFDTSTIVPDSVHFQLTLLTTYFIKNYIDAFIDRTTWVFLPSSFLLS